MSNITPYQATIDFDYLMEHYKDEVESVMDASRLLPMVLRKEVSITDTLVAIITGTLNILMYKTLDGEDATLTNVIKRYLTSTEEEK